MKIRSIIITMALAAIAAACNKPEIVDPSAEGLAPQLSPNQFSATFETSSSEDAKSKVSMNEDYSLSWVQGDAVSVFDAEGTNLLFTAKESGKSTALDGGEVLVDPEVTYYAVYPYSENNFVADGRITVEMPVVQTPVQGSFPTNVSVAKSDQRQLKFYNVCGLLGFEITQEDIVSVSVKSAGAQEYLTGKIAVDCSNITNPTYEVLDGVTEVTLVAEGTFATGVHYVSVLPQSFTGLTITMFKADGKVASVTSLSGFTLGRSRYLETGKIDTGNFSDKILTITNAAELQGFLAAADSYAAEDVVTIANDIDLKGYDLVPATSFAGTLTGAYTDGEETKNRALKNWNTTTALFETLSGEVRNVTVDATSSLVVQPTGDAAFIALNNAGTIDGCINNGVVTSVSETFTSTAARMVGTMAAVSTGTISNCVNNASITLTPKSVNMAASQFVGGIVGQAGGATADAEFISGCQNNGAIAFDATTYSCRLFIGGVLGGTPANTAPGYGSSTRVGTFENYGLVKSCKNNASLTVSSDGYSTKENYANIGGVVGYAEASLYDCDNTENGDITIEFPTSPDQEEKNFERPAIGGVAGTILYNVELCDNSADLEITGAFGTGTGYDNGIGMFQRAYFAGVVAFVGSSADTYLMTCTNSGNLTLDLSMYSSARTDAHIGGVAGNAIADVSGCENTGKLNIRNRMRGGYVGGVVGLLGQKEYVIKNTMSGCTNNGSIYYDLVNTEAVGNQSDNVYLGGVVGNMHYTEAELKTSHNLENGDITLVNGDAGGSYMIGGLAGLVKHKIQGGNSSAKRLKMYGDIIVNTRGVVTLGGICGQAHHQIIDVVVSNAKMQVVNPGSGSLIGGVAGDRVSAGTGDARMFVTTELSVSCESANGTYVGLFNGSRHETKNAFHTSQFLGTADVSNVKFGLVAGKLVKGSVILIGASSDTNKVVFPASITKDEETVALSDLEKDALIPWLFADDLTDGGVTLSYYGFNK